MSALPLLALLLAAEPLPSAPQEVRRAALAESRASATPHLALAGADSRRAEAAIEACRERLMRHGDGAADPRAREIARALLAASQDPGLSEPLARRALHAVAEGRDRLGEEVADAVARLAETGREGLRSDAAEVLGEVGGARHVPALARLASANPAREGAQVALERIGGKGTAAAFAKGISDASLPPAGRVALLRAAARRDLREVSASAVAALSEPAVAAEARKAVLRLAQRSDLPGLRAARDGSTDAAARGALERLIARLEKE